MEYVPTVAIFFLWIWPTSPWSIRYLSWVLMFFKCFFVLQSQFFRNPVPISSAYLPINWQIFRSQLKILCMQVFAWRNICENLLKTVSFTDCQQCIHMWNCDVKKFCVELSHGVQSSLRTTHQLGATFTNMFTEPANDPWTFVHRSGSCLLSTTGSLPLVFTISSLAMA